MRLELMGALVVFAAALAVGIIAPRNAGECGVVAGMLGWLLVLFRAPQKRHASTPPPHPHNNPQAWLAWRSRVRST
jgi:hypothetical protein